MIDCEAYLYFNPSPVVMSCKIVLKNFRICFDELLPLVKNVETPYYEEKCRINFKFRDRQLEIVCFQEFFKSINMNYMDIEEIFSEDNATWLLMFSRSEDPNFNTVIQSLYKTFNIVKSVVVS